jgi:pyrroloquinoline quinone (PQQ) biosynthesis protein C
MAFAETLIAAAQPFPVDANPLIVAVRTGQCTREDIRTFAIHSTRTAEAFPRVMCAVLGVCDEPRIRRALIANLLEEEGAVGWAPGEGLVFDPARHHGALARRFAHAAGATDAEIDAGNADSARWFDHAIRERNWLGAFAFFAIGFEVNVPPTYRLLVPALAERYGFSTDDLRFFIEHIGADDRHGAEGAALIASVAMNEDACRRALEGARRGGRTWWEFHRAHAPRVVAAAPR